MAARDCKNRAIPGSAVKPANLGRLQSETGGSYARARIVSKPRLACYALTRSAALTCSFRALWIEKNLEAYTAKYNLTLGQIPLALGF